MEQTKKQQNPTLKAIVIGLKLLLISALIAAIIAFVYAVTLEQYEKNVAEQKRLAMQAIFASETLTYVEEMPDGATSYTVYTVSENGAVVGYCVQLAASGFGGDVSLMVGYRADGSILGVQIVSHSETPGLGAKVEEEAHLSQYNGKSGELALDKDGGDVDAISGATISSRAVLEGVNEATKIVKNYMKKGEAA